MSTTQSFKRGWQQMCDSMGDDLNTFFRISYRALAVYYGIVAVLAPFSEYCFIGPRKFYLMWQKCVFGVGCAFAGFGFWKLGGAYRTTDQRIRLRAKPRGKLLGFRRAA